MAAPGFSHLSRHAPCTFCRISILHACMRACASILFPYICICLCTWCLIILLECRQPSCLHASCSRLSCKLASAVLCRPSLCSNAASKCMSCNGLLSLDSSAAMMLLELNVDVLRLKRALTPCRLVPHVPSSACWKRISILLIIVIIIIIITTTTIIITISILLLLLTLLFFIVIPTITICYCPHAGYTIHTVVALAHAGLIPLEASGVSEFTFPV